MTAVPRIYRAMPTGAVTAATSPIPVLVTLRWMTSGRAEVLAQAVAWTRTEVEMDWVFHGQARRDWVDAADVRRHGTPPRPADLAAETAPRPPRWTHVTHDAGNRARPKTRRPEPLEVALRHQRLRP